jgi:Kae1-associated kinase Bud32
MSKVFALGAEAEIIREGKVIIKTRIKKDYRIPELDRKIRLFRTKREIKIMQKLQNVVNLPRILDFSEKDFLIKMDFISGIPLVDVFDDLEQHDRDKMCEKIGQSVAKMHNNQVIHGDLTTSNILVMKDEIYFIDFGLSVVSDKIEDKAVDLHLMWQAFNSKHHEHSEKSFNSVIKGYKKVCKDYKNILERFEKVQNRGRYKRKKKDL